jgi:hypothetical protein
MYTVVTRSVFPPVRSLTGNTTLPCCQRKKKSIQGKKEKKKRKEIKPSFRLFDLS